MSSTQHIVLTVDNKVVYDSSSPATTTPAPAAATEIDVKNLKYINNPIQNREYYFVTIDINQNPPVRSDRKKVHSYPNLNFVRVLMKLRTNTRLRTRLGLATRIKTGVTAVHKYTFMKSLLLLVTAVNAEIIEGKVQRRVDAAGE